MISDAYLVTKLINNLQKTPICPPFFNANSDISKEVLFAL